MEPISFTILATAIITAIASSKGGKQAQDDLSTGMWDWIKPILIEEDEECVKDLETSPDDPDLAQELELRMKRKAKKDEAFADKLREFSKKMDGDKGGSQTTIQTNVLGDNIGGNQINYNK